MEEHPAGDGPAGAEDPTGASEPGGEAQLRPEAQALAGEAREIRRLVEAGARSPEELRELAARLREHREREDALWRAEVKPGLVKENRGRLRAPKTAAPAKSETPSSNAAMVGGALLALVLVVVIAANTSPWLLVVPPVVLVAWAWHHGRRAAS